MVLARDRFEAAITRCDNDQYARTGLGYVALRDGDTAEATDAFRTVVDVEPNNVDALVGLGLASWRVGDLDAVSRYFSTVIELAPEHPTAIEYLERVDGATRPATEARDAADDAWFAGETDVALGLYFARLDADASDGVALLRVGLMRAWREEYAAALELLDLLIELEPNNVDGRLARARVRAWSGDIPAARAEVDRILSVDPENADALAARALFQSWSGELDEALASYDALLSIAPEHGQAQLQFAQAMAWAGETDQSIDTYRAIVERNPGDVEARLGLATALAFTGDFDSSIGEYDEVLRADPTEIRALVGKAKTESWSGRLVAGEATASRAVDLDASSAPAWAGLGDIYRAQGRTAAALEAYETAARLAPTDPAVRDQVRSVRLSLAPVARPTFTVEEDSDGNRMITSAITTSWHPSPRLDIRARGYNRKLELPLSVGVLEREAWGMTVTGVYQFRPGWTVTGGAGGSLTNGRDDPRFLALSAGVRTPDRQPWGLGLNFSTNGLDETAALAEQGVRSSEVLLSARWRPAPMWQVNGNVSVGRFNGSEANGRRGGYIGGSRRLGRSFSLGAGYRFFSFEKDLNDGYFDPDYYGIAEVTSYWLYRTAPWTFLVELAPGLQQVRTVGELGTSLRSNARISYRIDTGREVSLSGGYSSAGLTSFATGASGYDYTALILSFNWVF